MFVYFTSYFKHRRWESYTYNKMVTASEEDSDISDTNNSDDDG